VAMHPDQIDITVEVVRHLIDEQFTQWRCLPVRRMNSSGTVNALFRLGDLLVVRLPLRYADADSTRRDLETEAQAARTLLGKTPFPTPEPVALGAPGAKYPLPWSVQTWLPGTPASDTDPGGSVPFAMDLAAFISAVRAIDTHGHTFSGKGRGGNLRDHDEWMRTCFDKSEDLLDVTPLRRMWAAFRELPPPSSEDTMTHGDLIPGNVLVSGGRLAGILDVGGLGPADPALDLVGGWHLLGDAPRQVFREALGCEDLEWERGKAWAFQQAMGLVWYYATTNPIMSRTGTRTLASLVGQPVV